jgi:peptidyl-prolyl cis-trans isomerase B (cyclophilin B)
MAKVSEDPPSPVDAYESPANATPVGDPVQPQYYQAPPVAAAKRPFDDWSVLAIVALIASCIGFTVPGIVMGHIALHKIKQTGQAGRGFAVAALIVGYVLFVLIVAAVIAWVLFLVFTLSIANSAASLGGDFG